MALCNAHYYGTRDPLGMQGDFTTSPEISQIFGELIGAWMSDTWERAGSPRGLLCELGPGRGTLMKDALRATHRHKPFHDNIAIRMIETSPHLRAVQQEHLSAAYPRISWHDTLESLPPLPLFLIANEFFDALPVHQYIRIRGTEEERKIDYREGSFCWADNGEVIREASPDSIAIVKQIAAHIKVYGGAALIIDYGYVNGSHGDTLQAVRHHAFTDVLRSPGEADLTAHVDFKALKDAAEKERVQVWGPTEQGVFLKRLGGELRAAALCENAPLESRNIILSGLERLVAPHQMGELFKVLAITSTLDKPAGF